ncbi:T6SS immunity protein Tli4 family protein [Duganella callida]|uniref:Tle cognate immunity protein 4 C-terminal domain-containing protein n=1 Tax=Duganella callida TaxID=2561932 RepID=A0A4Y9SJY7_9BURK|nr:T6SS immunity protein Tli4 family protein [Duganella callida]TFW22786.1 hypothetical protein E4L98_11745 [Duganella callida]
MKKNTFRVLFFLLLSILTLFEFKEKYIIWRLKVDEQSKALLMKRVCVGRFTIDVPKNYVVTYRQATVNGWDISTIEETNEAFYIRIKNKEDRLLSEKNEHNGKSLEISYDIKTNELTGKIFLYNRQRLDYYKNGNKTVTESVSIDASVRSKELSYDFTSELRSADDFDRLKEILNQLEILQDSESSRHGGFCFDHGMLRDPVPINYHEHVSIFLGIKSNPDLAISLSTTAGVRPSSSLLQRNEASVIQREYASHFHDLRIGARAINGVPGEEVLQRVDELNGVKGHNFMWESSGSTEDIFLPSLTLELSTGLGKPGAPVNSSLTDSEALALWDKISSSLRRRPEL